MIWSQLMSSHLFTKYILVFLIFSASGYALSNTQFTYNIIDGGIEVNGCIDECPADLIIPETIDDLSVISIGSNAFPSKYINSVLLPSTLTNIDDYAFEFNNLSSVIFPDNLARIGENAFYSNELTSINIPINVSIIEEGAFAGNPGEVNGNWNYFQIRDQILLLGCTNACPSNLVIPETINGLQVAFIGIEAFIDEGITDVTLPNGLLVIENEAFAENYLSEIIIPNTVVNISTTSFKYNTGIQNDFFSYLKIGSSAMLEGCIEPCPSNLVIPSSIDGNDVTLIDDSAFFDANITSLSLPDTLWYIEEWGFDNNFLTSVTIPSSIVGLMGTTFSDNLLESIHFLGDRPNMEDDDFARSPNLSLITYCPNTSGWPGEPIEGITPQLDQNCDSGNDGVINSEDSFAFDFPILDLQSGEPINIDNDGFFTFKTYPDGLEITGCVDLCPSKIVIPEIINAKEITRIGEEAFCHGDVNSITLPNTIRHIGEEAFCGDNIDSIVISNSAVSIVDGSFSDIDGDLYIIKPAEKNLNVFDLPTESNLYACDGVNEESDPINCENAYPDVYRNQLDQDSAQALIDANGHAEIPSSYTMIEDAAFMNTELKSIKLADSILHIGEEAFYGTNLDSIVLPSSVISIVDAFTDFQGDIYIIKPADQNLDVFDFPAEANLYACDNVSEEGNPLNCENAYTDVVRNQLDQDSAQALIDSDGHAQVPSFYTMIGEGAFADTELNSITLPNTILHIGEESFYGTNLDSIVLPSSVISLVHGAFEDFEGNLFLIKPSDQYINPYFLPHASIPFICDSLDNLDNPIDCDDFWQSLSLTSTSNMHWDFDDNGVVDALTDGLLLLRYTFGLEGESLTTNVIATDSALSAIEVEARVEASLSSADIDDDGHVDALTDGLLLLRYAFGLRGETLISGVISLRANRVLATEIEAYIESHLPSNVPKQNQ